MPTNNPPFETPALSLEVEYWDGQHSHFQKARLTREADVVAVTLASGEVERFFTRDIRVDPPLAKLPREVALPRGARLRCRDTEGFASLFPQTAWHGIHFFESRTRTAVLALAAVAAILAATWKWGIPLAADVAAQNTPHEVSRLLESRTLETLDQFFTKPTALSLYEKNRVEGLFRRLGPHLHSPHSMTLIYRNGGALGANAMALPAGTILVTDAMARKADDIALLGVLAHEAGHVESNHPIKALWQRVGLSLLWAGLVGDATQLGDISSGLVMTLTENGYSRNMEHEADVRALELLTTLGHSGKPLADLLMKLAPPPKKKNFRSWLFHWFDNHPDTADRAEFLRKTPSPNAGSSGAPQR